MLVVERFKESPTIVGAYRELLKPDILSSWFVNKLITICVKIVAWNKRTFRVELLKSKNGVNEGDTVR
jgi:hypothetical protein